MKTSASQIKTAELCVRKWAYAKIDGLERPASPAAALGTRVHEILEAWMISGALPDPDERYEYVSRTGAAVVRYPGRIAHAGLHLLPPPMAPGYEVEAQIEDPIFSGRIDLRGDGRVVDHKTTSSPQYAHTVDTLPNDPQALIYAATEMARTGRDRMTLEWNYFSVTERPRPWKVRVEVTRSDVAPKIDRLVDVARLLVRTRKSGYRAADLPYDPSACGAYGGCEFQDVCKRDPLKIFDNERQKSMDEPKASAAMEQLEMMLDAPPPPPPPPPPPADVINPPEAPPVSKDLPPPPPPPPAPDVPSDLAALDRAELKALAVARGIVDTGCRYGRDRLVEVLTTPTPAAAAAAPPPTPAAAAGAPPPTQVAAPPPPAKTPTTPAGILAEARELWRAVALRDDVDEAHSVTDAYLARFGGSE